MKSRLKLFSAKLKRSGLVSFAVVFLIALFSVAASAQVRTVTGTVTDDTDAPLPGAYVVEQGTQNGVTTDVDGTYSIQVERGKTLTYSFISFASTDVVVADQETIDVTLASDAQQLEDVVVIGYATVKRADVTGSVASVKMDKLNEAPVANFDQALAGRVTGVQVGGDSGEPGAGLNITIRGGNTVNGDNSPLYVLDGFIIEDFNPGILNPTDIQSIDILKDASATAIYGARGANGVVLITTKQAKYGKTQITYEGRIDVKNVANTLEVLSPYEFVKLSNEISPSNTSLRFFTNEAGEVVGDLEDYRNAPSANWQDEGFRTAFSNSHTLKIAAGGEKTRLDASINYMDDEGTLLETSFEKYNARLNVKHDISDKFDVTLGLIYASTERLGLNTEGTSSYSFVRNLITYPNVVNQFIEYGDANPLFDINPNEFDFNNIFIWHPIVSLENEYRSNKQNQFIANLAFRYRIGRRLTLDVRGSYNNDDRKNSSFNNSKTVYGRLINPINGISGRVDFRENRTLSNNNTLTYRNRFGKHDVTLLVGTSINDRNLGRTSIASIQIPQYAESQGINSLDEGTLTSTDDIVATVQERVQSVLSRFNYAFDNKYLLTASIRRDGSSKFAPGNNIGYFPSVAVSWKVEQEEFIKSLGFVSQLKFKAGYGKTGNDRIPGNARFDLFTSDEASYFINGQEFLGQRPTSSGANPNIEWETTDQYNVGLDLGLYDNRVAFTVEAYEKTTSDLLINSDTPPSLGISTIWTNSGTVRNRGLEFSLSTVNVQSDDFSWVTDFNISFNQNKVLFLPDGKPIFGNPNYYQRYRSNQYIVEEGRPLGNMFGYLSDGVYQPGDFVNYNPEDAMHTLQDGQPDYDGGATVRQPGDEKYKDLNGDGRITPDDKTIIGNGLAKHFGGLGNTLTYKGIQLSVFFQWSYGNDVMNANRLIFEEVNNRGQNQYATVLDRWSPTNMDTDMFRAGGRGLEDLSSRVIEDGSYIRLKTVNLSYNFSSLLLDRIRVSNLSVYLAAQNLLTWTNYSGFDPDVSVNNSAIMPGVDYSSYPISRTISAGLNVTF